MRTLTADIAKNEGKEVELFGWAETIRSHGKIVFIDLRDRSGTAQVVLSPEVIGEENLSTESVLKVTGMVKRRPPGMVNEKILNGEFEVSAKSIKNLNPKSGTPNISVDTDGYEIGEEVRMKYRYVDLRRGRLKKNLAVRHAIIKFIRDFLDKEGFWEIETPILTKSTPEGARDYLVPSRLQKGTFYALPQSPQQYKQLLMVGGVEKYFQIARCFRDEDTRGDRQPEFTQLDLEMSFVEREDVMHLNEELLTAIVRELYPEKKIQETPFPRLSYKTAMQEYGTDRPDLRKDKDDKNLLAFCWIVDFPFFEKTDGGKWTFTHNPFSAPKPECVKYLPEGPDGSNIEKIETTQYDVVLNGWEIGGGSMRTHDPDDLLKIFTILGYNTKEIEDKFAHMLTALRSGAPPHGGIAWGLDRLVMVLQNEPNIREVIAFPKTGDGRDLMMGAPSEVDQKQLDELSIKVIKSKDK